ncbi:hypothetical protein NDU88_004539, partial [Pleurodeles waltl]
SPSQCDNERTPETTTSPLDKSLSEENTPGGEDNDDDSGLSGILGQSTPVSLTVLTTTPPSPVATISQVTIRPQTCVPRTVNTIMCCPQYRY